MDFTSLLQQELHPGVAQLAKYIAELAPGTTLPARHNFRPNRIAAYLPFIFLVDVLPDRADYRWNLVGERIAVLFGTDGTRKLLSELGSETLRERLRTTYDKAVLTRDFLYLRGRYAWTGRSINIERLLIPMSDDNGKVSAILGLTLPDIPADMLDVFAGVGAATLEIDQQISGS